MKKLLSSGFAFTASLLFLDIVRPAIAVSAENYSVFHSSLRMIWGLLIVLGILLIIYGLVKKKVNLLNNSGKGAIKIVESRHLMPKKSLFLVEIRGKEYLLGCGADNISLIASLDTSSHQAADFQELLQESESNQPA